MTEKRTEPAQDVIAGRNAVKEALRSARPIESILVARGARNGSLGDIVSQAKAQGVAVKEVDPKRLEFLCPGANHQGIAALAAAQLNPLRFFVFDQRIHPKHLLTSCFVSTAFTPFDGLPRTGEGERGLRPPCRNTRPRC